MPYMEPAHRTPDEEEFGSLQGSSRSDSRLVRIAGSQRLSASADIPSSTKGGDVFLSDRVKDLETENKELRETIRKQGEFIVFLKHQIRDFMVDGGH